MFIPPGSRTSSVSLFFFCVFGFFFHECSQQCNPGDLRVLRKGMTLYHSESQLSSLPQRQDAMHMVSTHDTHTHMNQVLRILTGYHFVTHLWFQAIISTLPQHDPPEVNTPYAQDLLKRRCFHLLLSALTLSLKKKG